MLGDMLSALSFDSGLGALRGLMHTAKAEEHYKKLIKELEEGDLVEFPREGYSHWGVYVGHGKVIHLASLGSSKAATGASSSVFAKQKNSAMVQEGDLLAIADGSTARKNNNKDQKYTPLEKGKVVRTARRNLGKQGYNLLLANCEHFASWCRYGKAIGNQSDKFLAIIGIQKLEGDENFGNFAPPSTVQSVIGPTTAAVGPHTAVRGPTASVVGPRTFTYWVEGKYRKGK